MTKHSTFIVSRGRSVLIDGMQRGPGETVSLAADEGTRLIAAGFLNDPLAAPVNTLVLNNVAENPAGIGRQQS
jgi:hypothetical protein